MPPGTIVSTASTARICGARGEPAYCALVDGGRSRDTTPPRSSGRRRLERAAHGLDVELTLEAGLAVHGDRGVLRRRRQLPEHGAARVLGERDLVPERLDHAQRQTVDGAREQQAATDPVQQRDEQTSVALV